MSSSEDSNSESEHEKCVINMAVLSEYEQKRENNILKNNQFLTELGIQPNIKISKRSKHVKPMRKYSEPDSDDSVLSDYDEVKKGFIYDNKMYMHYIICVYLAKLIKSKAQQQITTKRHTGTRLCQIQKQALNDDGPEINDFDEVPPYIYQTLTDIQLRAQLPCILEKVGKTFVDRCKVCPIFESILSYLHFRSDPKLIIKGLKQKFQFELNSPIYKVIISINFFFLS